MKYIIVFRSAERVLFYTATGNWSTLRAHAEEFDRLSEAAEMTKAGSSFYPRPLFMHEKLIEIAFCHVKGS